MKHGEDLVRLADAKGRILMVGHILRYHPAILKLQQLIHDGALGKINYLYSNRLNIGKIRTEENILWSFAPHDISVMLSLLNEMPTRVSCQGGAYLNHDVFDVTLSHFDFPSGVQAHIFVSWLHPVKEQRLVVVGSDKMAVFDDTAEHKLVLYPHKVEWRNRHTDRGESRWRDSSNWKIGSRCGPNASISSTVSNPELLRSATARKDSGSCGCWMPASAPCRTGPIDLDCLRRGQPEKEAALLRARIRLR